MPANEANESDEFSLLEEIDETGNALSEISFGKKEVSSIDIIENGNTISHIKRDSSGNMVFFNIYHYVKKVSISFHKQPIGIYIFNYMFSIHINMAPDYIFYWDKDSGIGSDCKKKMRNYLKRRLFKNILIFKKENKITEIEREKMQSEIENGIGKS